MNRLTEIKFNDIFLVPNLLSVFRIFLTIPLGYFLAVGTNHATLYCFILIIIAGITDWLDGFFARLLNQRSRLGLFLDPLADKLVTIVLIIELIFTRGFPVWLAALIIGRDLLILSGGIIFKKKTKMVPASLLTGKYYFSSVAVLIASHIIRFNFGIWLMSIIAIILMILSTLFYFRRFLDVSKGKVLKDFEDKPVYKILRVGLTLIISIIFLYQLYIDILANYI